MSSTIYFIKKDKKKYVKKRYPTCLCLKNAKKKKSEEKERTKEWKGGGQQDKKDEIGQNMFK